MLSQPARCLIRRGVRPDCPSPVSAMCLHYIQRTLHTSQQAAAKKPQYISAKSRKIKNTEFVKRWNIENAALFGPKLKISKNTLRKRAEAAEIVTDNVLHGEVYQVGNEEGVLNTEHRTTDNNSKTTDSNKISENVKPKPRLRKPKPPTDTPTSSGDVAELDGILRFPLFRPQTDLSDLSGSMLVTDIPVLHGQPASRVTRILDQTRSEQSQFVLNRWIQQQMELLGKEGFGLAQKSKLGLCMFSKIVMLLLFLPLKVIAVTRWSKFVT